MVYDQDNDITFKEITGYYYQSDKVKFIDHVYRDKIIKSQYFSYEDGNIIFDRFNVYDGKNRLVYITIKGKDFPGFQNYTDVYIRVVFSYDREDGMIDYTGYRLMDFQDESYKAHQYSMYSQGTVNKRYMPVEVTTKISNLAVVEVKSSNNDAIWIAPLSYTYYETYEYADTKDDEAAIYTVYMREDNASTAEVLRAQRGIINGNDRKGEHEKWLLFRKTAETDRTGKKTIRTEAYSTEEAEIIETVIENGIETWRQVGAEYPPDGLYSKIKRIYIKDGLYLEHVLWSDDGYTDRGPSALICDDERVTFNRRDREFSSRLYMSLDVFPKDTSQIARNYYSPATPWKECGEGESEDEYTGETSEGTEQ
jgi:hypothetical protein